MVDFHVHSVFSDGTDSVKTIIEKASKRHFDFLSITDHDTFASQVEAIKIAGNYGVKYVTGIEISAEYPSTLHILGYNYDINNNDFYREISKLEKYRNDRNKKIIRNFQNLGFNISLNEVIEEAKGNIVGRPHFASVLLKKGYFKSREEIFEKYLGKGKIAYENKIRFSMEKCIDVIHKAGGIAIWAHPYSAVKEEDDIIPLLKKLLCFGLDGIEVYYSSYEPEMIAYLEKVADKYNLLKTAGSDYHGINKSIPLGVDINTNEIKKFILRLNS